VAGMTDEKEERKEKRKKKKEKISKKKPDFEIQNRALT